MKMVALIPARAGSKRIPGKNTKMLGGHPLLAYTIAATLESGVFSCVAVSSEDRETLEIAESYGARGWTRNRTLSGDDALDISWVDEILRSAGLGWWSSKPDAFAILRPTSPFRTADTIRRAHVRFQTQEVHSMRAVQPVKEHPGKMWYCGYKGYPMMPVIDLLSGNGQPWHSNPTQNLPSVYVQNASLEMAWSWVVPAFGTISGTKVAPFFTEGYEGFDLNTMDDWREAERLIKEGLVDLPSLPLARL